MPLIHQILAQTGEWDRIEKFSQELLGSDELITLINDGIAEAIDFYGMWLELDVKTLALAGFDEEPPLPWGDEIFQTYWTCRAKAAEFEQWHGRYSWRKRPPPPLESA